MSGLRAIVRTDTLARWIWENELGRGTKLAAAVAELVQAEGWTLVVTDDDGLRDLRSLDTGMELVDEEVEIGATVVAVRSRSVAE